MPVAAIQGQVCCLSSIGQEVLCDVGPAPQEGSRWSGKLDLCPVEGGLHGVVDAMQLQPGLLAGCRAEGSGQPEGCVPQHGVQARSAVKDIWDAAVVSAYVWVWEDLQRFRGFSTCWLSRSAYRLREEYSSMCVRSLIGMLHIGLAMRPTVIERTPSGFCG